MLQKGTYIMINIQTLPVGMAQANCYLVYNEKNALIVDPGDQADLISHTMAQLHIEPVAVLLTHTHYDHIGAVEAMREQYAVPLYVSTKEKEWLGDPNKNLSGLVGNPVRVKEAEYFFEPEETLTISDFSFTVVSTPGHSPGSVSFIFEGDEIVLSGDALFAGSIGRTDLPGSEPEKLIPGVRAELFTLPDHFTVYPGHGEWTTIGKEKKSNPFFN